jgi:NitT/TauT family transport system permease protein
MTMPQPRQLPLPSEPSGIFHAVGIPVAMFLAIGLAWYLAVTLLKVPPILLPGPMMVYDTIVAQRHLLLEATASTLMEIVLATVIAVVMGFATAVAISMSSMVRRLVFPYILMTQVVPKVALAPILIAWFGIGMQSRLILGFLIAYFPMVINSLAGLLGTSETELSYARSLAATKWQVLSKVQLPAALPSIMSGIKITAGVAVIGIVVGEFVASDRGLGKVIIESTAAMDTSLTIAGVIIISALGLLILGLLELVERRVVYWQAGR